MRLRDTLEKLDERLETITNSIIRQEVQLEEHIKKTNELEARIKEVDEDLKPLKARLDMASGAVKFGAALLTIVGAAVAVYRVTQL